MQKFEIGKTYETSSNCDSDTMYRFTVLSRTDKTVTVKGQFDKDSRRCKIYNWNQDYETIAPHGRNNSSCLLWASETSQWKAA